MRFLLTAAVPGLIMITTVFAQSNPQVLWERTFGGPNDEVAYAVRQTRDGGYVIGGVSRRPEDQRTNIYLVKTNPQGDTVWTREFGEDQYDETARSLEVVADGGFIVAGSTNTVSGHRTDMLLIRADSLGNTLWAHTYGGVNGEEAFAVKPTGDGGYILVGWTGSYGPAHRNVYIVKTDAAGDTLWTRAYGTESVEEAWAVQETADSGFIVAGYADGQLEDTDAYVLRTDSRGDTNWTRKYGGRRNEDARAILQTSDGGFAMAAETWSYDMPAMYLVRTDETGAVLWTRAYGPTLEFGADEVLDLQRTVDGGFALAGNSLYWQDEVLRFDAKLVRTNSDGDTLWTALYGDSGAQTFNSVQITDDGGYVLTGSTEFGPGGVDFYVVRTGSEVNSAWPALNRQIPAVYSLTACPNPFNLVTELVYDLPEPGCVSLRVFDLFGRQVAVLTDGVTGAGNHRVTFDGGRLASGIYFAHLGASGFSETKKLVLLR